MNRNEMLNWLVDNLDEWPKTDSITTLPAIPRSGFDWILHANVGWIVRRCGELTALDITESDWNAARHEIVTDINDEDINTDAPPSPYHVRNIWKNAEWIDFYRMYDMLKAGKVHEVGDSAIEHAMKKLTALGLRSGGKSKIQDIEEAIWSLQNAIKDIKESV
jgi:hypothetical protein